jgi:hypothetical protein
MPALWLAVRSREELMARDNELKGSGVYKNVPSEIVKAGKELALDEKIRKIMGSERSTQSAAALQLRIDGAAWSDIATILEYDSPSKARQAVELALAQEAKSPEKVDHIRLVNSKRLERIYRSLAVRATNPSDPDHLQYVRAAVIVIDRHSRLWGADSPQQMNVTVSPSAGEIENWVAKMSHTVHGEISEADIIDAEVIESGE